MRYIKNNKLFDLMTYWIFPPIMLYCLFFTNFSITKYTIAFKVVRMLFTSFLFIDHRPWMCFDEMSLNLSPEKKTYYISFIFLSIAKYFMLLLLLAYIVTTIVFL